jgi:hypothetical protein
MGTLHTLGQTLNEELLFGALLLTALCKKYPEPAAGSWRLSFVLHYVLPLIASWMAESTAAAFFVLLPSVCQQHLDLKAGHCFFPSLHFSINLVGPTALHTENGGRIDRTQIFNRIPSGWAVFVCCFRRLAHAGCALLLGRPVLA